MTSTHSQSPDRPVRVLFLCTGNSGRSQIAEALLEATGGAGFDVKSAGIDPHGVNPLTVQVLAESGIDWSGARSKGIGEFLDQNFDYVVTVCGRAREACPTFPGARRMLHWDLDDPADVQGSDEAKLGAFRRTKAEVEERLPALIGAARGTPAAS
jgi:thioredoxin type arsenate reductase